MGPTGPKFLAHSLRLHYLFSSLSPLTRPIVRFAHNFQKVSAEAQKKGRNRTIYIWHVLELHDRGTHQF